MPECFFADDVYVTQKWHRFSAMNPLSADCISHNAKHGYFSDVVPTQEIQWGVAANYRHPGFVYTQKSLNVSSLFSESANSHFNLPRSPLFSLSAHSFLMAEPLETERIISIEKSVFPADISVCVRISGHDAERYSLAWEELFQATSFSMTISVSSALLQRENSRSVRKKSAMRNVSMRCTAASASKMVFFGGLHL